MKKTTTFFKTLLVAVALLVGAGNVWADEVVGSTTDDYLANKSTSITIADGGSIHYQFSQQTAGTANPQGFVLVATASEEGAPLVALRCDNWENASWTNAGCQNNFDWTDFPALMNGASFDMTVTYCGGIFFMNAMVTGSDNNEYSYSYIRAIAGNPSSLVVYLSVDHAQLTITASDYTALSMASTRRVMESENYEKATVTDWTCPNGASELKTGDATYGNYAQCQAGSGSGNRTAYKSVVYDNDPDGFLSPALNMEGYKIEFDFCLVSGNVEDRSSSQFVVTTAGPNLVTNNSYTGTDYLFTLSNSINYDEVAEGKSTKKNQIWYVNDLTNNENSKNVTLDEDWYHMTMVVTSSTVVSTISRGDIHVVTVAVAVENLPKIKGFWTLLGRGSGKVNFDNLAIYDYVETEPISRILVKQDYEAATAADWTSPNGIVSFMTDDALYGNYAQVEASGNGNRSCYKSVTYVYAPDGFVTPDMNVGGYNIEFDLRMAGGRQKDRSVGQFVVPTISDGLPTNEGYTGTDYIFALSQPTNTTGALEKTWYINDLTNKANAITLEDAWYHYKLSITGTTVEYTITKVGASAATATGTLAVKGLPVIKGFWALLGRTFGRIAFDNLKIYDYTAEETVSEPTFAFKKVDGEDRVYILSNPNGRGSLFYTTAPAEEAPELGSGAYEAATDMDIEVTYNASGTYYAYVLTETGTASPLVSLEVTAGALTLAKPVFTIVDMVEGNDGQYYPKVSFVSDNTNLEGAPKATLSVASPYTFTETGTLTVTVTAEGYTTASATYTVANPYEKAKTIDFGALTAGDFDTDVWESATGAPRDYWTQRAAQIPADVTYYKLKQTSDTKDNPDNSAVLDGITISNYYQRAPEVYIGYGLLTPYTALGGSSNNMNFTVNDATEADIVVYNGWNNYGNGTFNTVQTGDKVFGLYRYDTMLRTINVYSPVLPENVQKTVSAVGYATLCSEYALDFSQVEGLTAYIAKVADGVVSFEEVTEVPANTGVLLKGDAKTYDIPVVASAEAVEGNAFVGVNEATTVDNAGIFVLMNGNKGVGFYKTTKAFTVGAHTAYLPADAAARAFIGFGDEATGISAVNRAEEDGEAIFNLQGLRVGKAVKGLYIKNGKKVIVK